MASYLVCASPRSGTELLCRGLAATGVAGCPREYFLAEDPQPSWLRANDPGRTGSSRAHGLPGPGPGPSDAPSIQRPERGLGSRLPRGQGIPPGAL